MGIDPQKYYKNTIRNNSHIALAWEHKELAEWERTRYLAFTAYRTVFSMDGKPVFKKIKTPMDLFKLVSDKIEVITTEDAANAEFGLTKK